MKARERPDVTKGNTYKIETGCGNLYITINSDEVGVSEVFARLGKCGGCQSSQNEAIGRLISLAFRYGIDPQEVIDAIKNIRCPRPYLGKTLSCADGIARALNIYLNGEEKKEGFFDFNKVNLEICPECGEQTVALEEGCKKCYSCAWTECG